MVRFLGYELKKGMEGMVTGSGAGVGQDNL